MTEEELYILATNNIKATLELIKYKDNFLYQELELIYKSIDKIPKNCFKDNLCGPLPNCNTEQTILLVQKFLRLCSKKYERQFIEDLKNHKIIIDKEKGNYCNSTFKKNGNIDYVVHIEQTGTIKDCYKLIHEYFHALNLNKSCFRFAISECISITAELLFLDFLEQNGVSRYDIALISTDRKHAFNNNCNYLKILLPLYIEVLKKGTIEDDIYEKQISPLIKKETFLSFLKTEILESDDNNRLHKICSYRHCLGYIYASSFHNKGFDERKLATANRALTNGDSKKFSSIIDSSVFDSYPLYIIKKELENYIPSQYAKQHKKVRRILSK